MLLLFALILMFISMALTVNVYSIFSPFIQQLGDITDFNQAYYGAISSLERANLALRYHYPGFEGSGGNMDGIWVGPISDQDLTKFGRLNNGSNGMIWQILSMSNGVIPSDKGNIDPDFVTSANSWFNQFEYFQNITLNLSQDTGTEPYETWSITYIWWLSLISGTIKLPVKIYSSLWDLKDDEHDLDWDGLLDDIVIGRSLKGKDNWEDFVILPTVYANFSAWLILSGDTNIREDIINDISAGNWSIQFATNKNPVNGLGGGTTSIPREDIPYHNVIPSNSSLSWEDFNNILASTIPGHSITWIQLNLFTTNLFDGLNGIYPFLEYRFEFENSLWGKVRVPDLFYTLKGIGKVGAYKVQIIHKKPTTTQSQFSQFTIIF